VRRRGSIPVRALAVVAGACALELAAPAGAGAVVSDVHPIDGPSPELTAEVDAAMAEDGSGGVVYLKREGGREHVFAVQFRDGEWGAPQRVDVGQGFDSSWPQIAAGDGGRLLVTWVQEFGVGSDRVFSATLDPGASGFRPPVPVDFNVGEATSTFPDLAMSRGGHAYLVYCVVTDTSPNNPPGYLGLDVRVARYSNRLWSALGTIDRNPAIPIRAPTRASGPRVGIDIQGQGVVAWQEPDDEFVDRVYARRVFGTRIGIPLQVSPSTWEGAPLRGPADAFALDVSGFGQAAVAFRQQPGVGSLLGGTRLLVNTMPDVFTEGAGAFGQARAVDGTAREGLGPPSVAVDPKGLFVTGFGSGPATLLGSGSDTTVGEVERIDRAQSTIGGDPLVDVADTGAAVAAWRELVGGAGVVGIQERRADGVAESTTLSAPSGGSIGPAAIGGSGLGDAIVAWPQGEGANQQIAGAVVDAPPDPFLVLLPNGWQRKRKIPISWDRTLNAIGGVTYSVSVDDEPVIEGIKGHRATLRPDDTENGRSRVQVFALDDAGQETGSSRGRLQIDRRPPRVRLRRRGKVVAVKVSDGGRRTSSGVRRAKISYGDGSRGTAKGDRRGTARDKHRFERPGVYRVVVRARDRAGNGASLRRKVRVR
jgi:hypothetical protein